MEAKNDATLAEKLIACAEASAQRFRAKHGEEARLPGSIRLMFSAADFIEKQQSEILSLEDQNRKVMQALAEHASCDTCKSGPVKQCPVRGECGDDRSLWEFDNA